MIRVSAEPITSPGCASAKSRCIGEGIGIRSVVRLTLSADHRLIDGELAARFLDDLRGRLEDPASLRGKRLDL
jgi:pyruvate dehydrogenase E2 component (dihydrolipoamide acetyltransferase)